MTDEEVKRIFEGVRKRENTFQSFDYYYSDLYKISLGRENLSPNDYGLTEKDIDDYIKQIKVDREAYEKIWDREWKITIIIANVVVIAIYVLLTFYLCKESPSYIGKAVFSIIWIGILIGLCNIINKIVKTYFIATRKVQSQKNDVIEKFLNDALWEYCYHREEAEKKLNEKLERSSREVKKESVK